MKELEEILYTNETLDISFDELDSVAQFDSTMRSLIKPLLDNPNCDRQKLLDFLDGAMWSLMCLCREIDSPTGLE